MRCARKSLSLQFPFSHIVAFAIVADMKKTEANLELLLPCRSLRPADKHPPEEEHLRRNPLLDGPRGTNTWKRLPLPGAAWRNSLGALADGAD